MSRTRQSIKNIFSGIFAQLFLAFVSFFTTKIIKESLGFEYLGLNGVFSNVISLLNLTELGIGSAIVFALYKPLAEKDNKLICSIMQFYKKAYFIIASIIFILGIILIPFLKYIVKTSLPQYYVTVVFLLFLANTIISYLLAYRTTLIIADQKNYIVTLYTLITTAITKVLQLVLFIYTHSFIIFLLINLISSFIINLVLYYKAEKLYPYLKEKNKIPLPVQVKQMFFTKVKALFLHSLGNFCVNGTDNLLISFFLGVSLVGKYGSYITIISLVNSLFNNIYNGITSSVGNFLAEKTEDEQYILYSKIENINGVFVTFIPICFAVLLNPFINIWLGEDAVLPYYIPLLLGINSFLGIIRRPVGVIKNAAGMFEPDRYAPLIESGVNLIVSVLLGYFIGLPGIILGTIASSLLVSGWVQPLVVYKYLFKKSIWNYILLFIKNIFITTTGYVICCFIIRYINFSNVYIDLVCKFLATIIFLIAYLSILYIRKIAEIIKGNFIR